MNSKNPTNSTDSDRGFLKGIKLPAFLDCYQEWHAFVEGFSEVLCPWPAKYKLSGKLLDDLRNEHHYYMFGRVLGILGWLTICCVIKEVFF